MNALNRIFGGPPLWVIIRLIILSIVVGFVLDWLNLTPYALIDRLIDMIQRLIARGFSAIRDIGTYLMLGAILVVPAWILIRLFRGVGGGGR
ncbi:MAG: DUF6460 domain-containing protein [Labrys sp. (in: a-proteobacteria)]|jgi:hypothetical protein